MTADMGSLALMASVYVAVAALGFALFAGVRRSAVALQRARLLMVVFAGLITLASLSLLNALVNSDFSLAYVTGYTERTLPFGYKVAAFWAGQEGSLLLWALLLAWMGAVYVWQTRKHQDAMNAGAVGTLAIVSGFFSILMLFAANPFKTIPAPVDGRGLNPLLQDPGMIIHPPLLFVGYAGFTVPFAIMIGAMLSRRMDNQWIVTIRRWTIFSWLFLTAGIILGAQWAYIELGWGGYWAWDPVENASLLPWLTSTALLHSVIMQHQRGMFKIWNAGLIAATFLLCIFGTYLTRSGVIQSVHAFGASKVGTFFLLFLITMTLASIAILIWRNRCLRSEHALERLICKEGAFLGINVLLTIITAITLIGTIWPIISTTFTGEAVTVGPPFYNKVVIPLALLLLALMAVGPLLRTGCDAARQLWSGARTPVALGIGSTILAVALGLRDSWAITCTLIATTALAAAAIQLVRNYRKFAVGEEGSIGGILLRMIDSNHRRYGGIIVHVGMILILIGVAGSSLFAIDEEFQASPGDTRQVGRYTVEYRNIQEVRDVNFTAVQAHVILTEPAGKCSDLYPQVRFYDKSEQAHSEVALRWNLLDDVYITLAGWEDGGRRVAMHVMVNPLVVWIWIGSVIVVLGSVLSLLPRLMQVRLPQTAALPSDPALSLPLVSAKGAKMTCPLR